MGAILGRLHKPLGLMAEHGVMLIQSSRVASPAIAPTKSSRGKFAATSKHRTHNLNPTFKGGQLLLAPLKSQAEESEVSKGANGKGASQVEAPFHMNAVLCQPEMVPLVLGT